MLTRFLSASRRGFSASDQELKNLCRTATSNALAEAVKSLRSPMGWELAQKIEDTEVHQNILIRNANVYRQEGKVQCSPMKIMSFLRDPYKTRLWNEPVIESKVLKNLGEFRVIYQKMMVPWPSKIRDLVFADTLHEIENGTAYLMASIAYDQAPETPAAARSTLNWGAIMAQEHEYDKDSSYVTYISSWSLIEGSNSLKLADYLIRKRNPFILKLRKLLID